MLAGMMVTGKHELRFDADGGFEVLTHPADEAECPVPGIVAGLGGPPPHEGDWILESVPAGSSWTVAGDEGDDGGPDRD